MDNSIQRLLKAIASVHEDAAVDGEAGEDTDPTTDEDLALLLSLEQDGLLVDPPRKGQFDLSFLGDQTDDELWLRVESGVRRLAAVVTARLDATLVALDQLPTLLTQYRRLEPIEATLRDASRHEPSQLAEVLELPDSDENVRIRLLVGPVERGKGTIRLQIENMQPRSPLVGARVRLLGQNRSLLERAPTSIDGSVTFAELPQNDYTIVIRHDGAQWEIGLNLLPHSG